MLPNHSASPQIPLAVHLRDDATIDNFLAIATVAPVVHALEQQLSKGGESMIFIHGPAGVGKSHLLQGACHRAGSGALYLPLAQLRDFTPQHVLQDVDAQQLVCLDDVQAVLADPAWELALFSLYNRAQQSGCHLLLAATAAPRALAVALPDLQSRLSWGVVYQLPVPDDEQRASILQFRAHRRGLSMPDEVARYIVNRAPRGLTQLVQILDQLDRASLAEQRKLSVPFVRKVLTL